MLHISSGRGSPCVLDRVTLDCACTEFLWQYNPGRDDRLGAFAPYPAGRVRSSTYLSGKRVNQELMAVTGGTATLHTAGPAAYRAQAHLLRKSPGN